MTDRAAIREMARQISEQTGRSIEVEGLEDESELEANDDPDADDHMGVDTSLLPPSSQILSLVARIPSLSRATIVVIDGLDLFAAHARQALLYCLFDTAQSIRAGSSSKGLAVVGITSRVDTINLLEKRVKSRFSHRVVRMSSPQTLESYLGVARALLCPRISDGDEDHDEWTSRWENSVEVATPYCLSPDLTAFLGIPRRRSGSRSLLRGL